MLESVKADREYALAAREIDSVIQVKVDLQFRIRID